MRRTILTVAIAILLIGSGNPATAHESISRHTDSRGDGQADVWRSKREKIHIAPTDHRQRFQVSGPLGPDWSVEVFVDSRGGPRADFKLWAFEDLGTSGCGGRRLFGARIRVRCDRAMAGVGEWRLWWSMRVGVLRSTKPIRWRVITDYPGDPTPGVPERDKAPNAGWYV